jgi:O-antigen/teichoic acid export membrane protein
MAIESVPLNPASHRLAFFRQSGWMMIATTVSGGLMYAVHMVARQMPKEEYGVFTTLLQVVALMAIPAVGLQTVFAQQVAAAVTEEQRRLAVSTFRGVWRGIFFLWLVMAAVVAVFWKPALADLQVGNPAALAMTVLIGLTSMWMPLMMGMMQGRQNFLWLGWAIILNGVARFGLICVVVLLLGGWAAGAMGAVLGGMAVLIVMCAWQMRDLWRGLKMRVDWSAWLKRVVPLTLGLGAATFMLSADMIFTQENFPKDQTAFYAAAGMIGRALVFFTQPLTLVMFPKIAHSSARSEKTDVLAHTLGLTALAGGAAAVACTLFPSLPLRIIYDKSFFDVATPLVPWFAWCMLPLVLSNVLINALLAKGRFAAVPWLAAVAVGYGVALSVVGRHAGALTDPQAGFIMMIQTLGVCSTVLFAICVWFTWGGESKAD